MKISTLQGTIGLLFSVLIIANVFAFVMSMKQSQSIQEFEMKTHALKLENSDLEEAMYNVNSLQYAASRAADLSFTAKAKPFYLHTMGVARRN